MIAFEATRSAGTTDLGTAPVGLDAPLGLTQADLAQWCSDRQAAGTSGLSYDARRWLRSCAEAMGSTGGAPNTPGTPGTSPTSPAATTNPPAVPPTTTKAPTGGGGGGTGGGSGGHPAPPQNVGPAGPRVPINASTTGYPAGTALSGLSKPSSNQTYVGVSMGGGTITASNIVLRNCAINGETVFTGNKVTIDHCTITGGVSLSGGDDFVFTNNNVTNWGDGLHITSDSGQVNRVTVSRNWLHSPKPDCSDHADGMQLLGVNGITITDNIIDLGAWIICGSDPNNGPLNGAFQVEDTQGADVNGTIDHNFLNGGGYTARFYQCSGFTFTSNAFGNSARWGTIAVPSNNRGCFTNWSDNLDANGKNIAITSG